MTIRAGAKINKSMTKASAVNINDISKLTKDRIIGGDCSSDIAGVVTSNHVNKSFSGLSDNCWLPKSRSVASSNNRLDIYRNRQLIVCAAEQISVKSFCVWMLPECKHIHRYQWSSHRCQCRTNWPELLTSCFRKLRAFTARSQIMRSARPYRFIHYEMIFGD